jgi:type II secretory pathway component PulM
MKRRVAIVLAAVCILCILPALLYVWLHSRIEPLSPVIQQTRQDITALSAAVNDIRSATGAFPAEQDALTALSQRGVSLNLVDPWGTPYRYTLSNDTFEIRCASFDKVFNTTDDITSY